VSTVSRSDLDMADSSGRNPRKDLLDFVVRKRSMLRSAQHGEHVRRRSPAFLVPDQREIDFRSPRENGPFMYGYTGS
jgi:hypothetical protein